MLVILVEIYKENLASYRCIGGKGRYILRKAFQIILNIFIPNQNSAIDSSLVIIESESIMNKLFILCILKRSFIHV